MKTTGITGLAVKDGMPRAAILAVFFWFFLLAVPEVCHAESGHELTPSEALEWSRQRLREDRDDEAREMLERHFRLASESLGPDAPETLEIMSLLVKMRWLESDEVVATAMSKDLIGRLRRGKGEFSPEAVRALRMVAMYLTNWDDRKAYLEPEFSGYLEWFEANARSAQDPESLFVPLDALKDAELPNLHTRLLATATLVAMNQSGASIAGRARRNGADPGAVYPSG